MVIAGVPDGMDEPGPPPLPLLDPDRQTSLERLAALVESCGDGTVAFHARTPRATPPGCWLMGADGLGVRIDRIGEEATALHPDRIDAVVAALDRIEPLLDLIEARTGWAVEPATTAASPPPDTLVVELAAERDGAALARFALAVPIELLAGTEEVALLGDRLARVPLPCRLRAAAAHLSVEDAGAIGPGDLVLLHPAPWAATLSADPAGEIAGIFDPASGALSGHHHERNTALSEGEPGRVEDIKAFRVPVDVRLSAASATLAELAALREGGSLMLGPLTAGLAVELSVGGRPLAAGELVRLGDRYAVLVERAIAPTIPTGND